MNRIPRTFINELLTRCDIVELIDARVPLRKKGANHSACCPFHNEKTPSFTVSQAKQFYHCFGCGANGNAIGFLMEFDRLTFVEAIEQLAAYCGLTVPRENDAAPIAKSVSPDLYQLMEKVAVFYQQQLRQHLPAIDYLKQRGLSGQIAKEFGIGYAPDSWDAVLKKINQVAELASAGLIIEKAKNNFYDRFRDRIMFPIRDKRGRVIGFGGRILDKGEPKYLNSPETPIFHKGSELYGLYEACQAQRNLTSLLVVEGYMDVVALAQHNIHNVVATLGTATTAEHIQRLFRLVPEIIFCFDGDRAGQAAAWKALDVTLPYLQDGRQAKFLLLPENEDPDSLVRKEGTEKFMARANNATSLADFLFVYLSKQTNMTSAEGKARYAKLVVPLLHKLPTGVLQQLLFERLANAVRMEVDTLKNITREKTVATSTLNAQKSLKRSPMRMAIALLLQHPQLVQSLPDAREQWILPGSELLKELIDLLKQTPQLTTAVLVEYWRDRAEHVLLSQLASWDLALPEAGVEQEFLGTITRLQQMNKAQLAEQLMGRIDNLSDAERMTLQKLITTDKQCKENL
jgi:DNA primase